MKDTILSFVRHALTFGGGYLVAKGYFTNDSLNTLIPALVTAIGAIWGTVDEYLAAKKLKP